MSNPVMDQDRVEHLAARVGASSRKGVLPAWPRPAKELPLVDLDVKWVRFSTLNHRTRSEQRKLIDSSGELELFTADPLGDEAQKAQYRILSYQTGFEDLKIDLKDRGQQQPAVVTAEGVLINGNRRAAALRCLFVDDDHAPSRYVSCLVLPADATASELVDLETELQIAREFKEDYTWVNEAMLIEELFEREGKDWSRVARRMHRDVSFVKEQYEKLQQLHQLVALSNGTRYHADFVPNESAFTELSKHVRNKSAEEAASVRNAYFLGTLTGVNYRTLRHLRRADASELILNEIKTVPSLSGLTSSMDQADEITPDILDEVLGTDPTSTAPGLEEVLSVFAQAGGAATIEIDDKKVEVDDLIESVRDAVDAAAEEAANQQDDDAALVEPTNQLKKCVRSVGRARESLQRARTFKDWDEQDFKNKIKELRDAIDDLEQVT